MIKLLLHLEGLCIFLLALFGYSMLMGSWAMFALLFFVPDLSMAGYLVNKRIGSYTYNTMHTYVLPTLLITAGGFVSFLLPQVGLILAAHIGLDRLLGFGLKYPESFTQTHLQKV
jgi:hypothetical protein